LAEDPNTNTIELATELTIAWLSNPNTHASADEVPSFLQKMHEAVNKMASPQASDEAPAAAEYTPAVSARKSLASKDHILSMIDGKPYKALRRHLSGHGLTPDQYRERYGLKSDYPMVSESYSQVRRDMANKIGLGRKPKVAAASAPKGNAAQASAPAAKTAPAKRRGRPKKAQPEQA
jgi:predicted transcriptional regulator